MNLLIFSGAKLHRVSRQGRWTPGSLQVRGERSAGLFPPPPGLHIACVNKGQLSPRFLHVAFRQQLIRETQRHMAPGPSSDTVLCYHCSSQPSPRSPLFTLMRQCLSPLCLWPCQVDFPPGDKKFALWGAKKLPEHCRIPGREEGQRFHSNSRVFLRGGSSTSPAHS